MFVDFGFFMRGGHVIACLFMWITRVFIEYSFATLCSDCRYGGVSHERRTAMASRTILFSCSRGKLSETLAVISSGRGSPKCSPSVNQQGHVSNSRGILLRIHTILIRQQNQ